MYSKMEMIHIIVDALRKNHSFAQLVMAITTKFHLDPDYYTQDYFYDNGLYDVYMYLFDLKNHIGHDHEHGGEG